MLPNDGRVVSSFIVQALRNDPITIYGNGSQTRSFCYVDDMIEGLMHLMNSRDDFVGPVNLGNPVEMSIRDIAIKIVERVQSKSRLVFEPLPEDDPPQRKPVIDLAISELGWEPLVGFDEGLDRTIDYFRKLLNT